MSNWQHCALYVGGDHDSAGIEGDDEMSGFREERRQSLERLGVSAEAVMAFLEQKGMLDAREELRRILEKEQNEKKRPSLPEQSTQDSGTSGSRSRGTSPSSFTFVNYDASSRSSAEGNREIPELTGRIIVSSGVGVRKRRSTGSIGQRTVETYDTSEQTHSSETVKIKRSNSTPEVSLSSSGSAEQFLRSRSIDSRTITVSLKKPSSYWNPSQTNSDNVGGNGFTEGRALSSSLHSHLSQDAYDPDMAIVSADNWDPRQQKELDDQALCIAFATSELDLKDETFNTHQVSAIGYTSFSQGDRTDEAAHSALVQGNGYTMCSSLIGEEARLAAQNEARKIDESGALVDAEDSAFAFAVVASEMDQKTQMVAWTSEQASLADQESLDSSVEDGNDQSTTDDTVEEDNSTIDGVGLGSFRASTTSLQSLERSTEPIHVNHSPPEEPTATIVDCEMVEAELVNPVDAFLVKEDYGFFKRRRNKYICIFIFLSLFILAVAAIVVPVRRKKSVSGTNEPLELYSPEERQQLIYKAILPLTTESALSKNTTSQSKAFTWVTNEKVVRADDFARVQQRFALGVLYYELQGPGWIEEFDFLSPKHECQWSDIAVSCDDEENVIGLKLVENGLSGVIPREILGLQKLKELWLDFNRLRGRIPSFLVNLTELEAISLSNNGFAGKFPNNIYQLDLRVLDVSENVLKGTIPPEAYELPNLDFWSIYGNNFTGTIDSAIGQLQNLTSVALFRNQLKGTIPSEFGQLKKLENLQISDNMLTGTIPETLGNLQNLWRMSLSYNPVVGTVPKSFGTMSSLWRLYLQTTNLTGDVTFLCEAHPDLDVFRVDLQEVVCPCCTCCD